MNKVSDFFIKTNWAIKPLMDSPFHWLLSSRLVLLKFKGRKTGAEFVTPVGYTSFGDTIIITLTETHNRQWWRNYREVWPMELKHKGKWRSGSAILIEPGSDQYREWFEKIFNRDRFMPKIFKIHDYDRNVGLSKAQLDLLVANHSGLVKFSDAASNAGK